MGRPAYRTRPRRCGLYHLPLEELGALADRRRQLARAGRLRRPGQRDRHLHHRPEHQLHQRLQRLLQVLRLLPHGEGRRRLRDHAARRWTGRSRRPWRSGGTQILLQGGHHPKLSKQWYLDLLSHIKAEVSRRSTSTGSAPASSSISARCFRSPLEKIICGFQSGGAGLGSGRRRGNPGGPRAPAGVAAQGDDATIGWR